ncbi:MAG TPA: DUF4258 domain-containing protein [bacterium]|nr:DUF4258 domain-containing protein [bacterium]
MRFRISGHAYNEMREREIPSEMVENLMTSPQQIVPEYDGKAAYQSQFLFENGKIYLLRAIVDELADPCVVVTVYRTSKIGKYWRQP